jgi:hypothetical protein
MHKTITSQQPIQDKIYTIRGIQVMVDRDLALLYGVETRRLNEQVKRNIERFPQEFMFQMIPEELENWKSQIATSSKWFAVSKMGINMLDIIGKPGDWQSETK